jgi:hypothetical protein
VAGLGLEAVRHFDLTGFDHYGRVVRELSLELVLLLGCVDARTPQGPGNEHQDATTDGDE